MKSNPIRKEEIINIEEFKKRMSVIEFMSQFVDDSEIFNPNSTKFKTFLMQSFAHLHSDFHYLSFLNNEDIDHELVRASEILQILPLNSVKIGAKLFGDMSEIDIHKFWIRFFTLFQEKSNPISVDSILNFSWETKTNFLKNINSTIHYLNYNFPVVSTKKLDNINFKEEIEKWKEISIFNDFTLNESEMSNFDTEQQNDINVEKLIIDVVQVITTYSNLKNMNQDINSEYCGFFENFISHTKDIVNQKNYFSVIDSSFLNNLYSKMMSKSESDCLTNLYFMKRCSNMIKILKTKIK